MEYWYVKCLGERNEIYSNAWINSNNDSTSGSGVVGSGRE